MANTNYGEVLCQAVDEIVQKRLEGVSYDQTILCTIIDDDKKAEGLYIVSNNGTVKFEAYSDNTSYRKNDNVYVHIPGGDWNQQKTIVSKKTNKKDEPFIYKRPFETLVDITGNVITKAISATGLTANDEETRLVELWKKDEVLSSYTRLGIQAGFKSLLNPFYDDNGNIYNVDSGDYGLKLTLTTKQDKTSEESDDIVSDYVIYLNCEDMNGNPYDFQTYYIQEKVVDISQIGTITSMKLEFYQTPGTFKSGDKILPYKDFLGNKLLSNLFVSEPYISLGYDTADFEDEKVLVYTLDTSTYSRNSEKNYKDIQLRWIHKLDDGTFKSIGPNEEMEFEVRWYKFELGHSSADEYSGVYWKNWSKQEHYYNAETGLWDNNYNVLNDEYQQLIDSNSEIDLNPSFFNTKLIIDSGIQNEQIKAIIIYNGRPYRSNILKFENENEVVNKATIDAIQALSIQCDDNTYGNYRIYGQNGQLLDQADARKPRAWVPYFRSAAAGEDVAPTELFEAEEVEWIIPTKNTMLKVDVSGFNKDNISYEQNNDERLHIKLYQDDDPNTKDFPLSYTINSYYSQNYSDNTIQCKIVKNGITYTAVKEHTFGPSGTMGSDCTFVLDFEGNAAALTVGDTEAAVTVVAKLYDYENNEVEITAENEIDWDWKTSDENIELIEDGIRAELKLNASSITTNYNILQASIKWGDGELIAYLPIPIRTSTEYAYISGATQVIYDSDGNISNLYANPYIMYDANGKEVEGVLWSIVEANAELETDDQAKEKAYAYVPKIIQDSKGNQYLKPLNFYVKDANEKVCLQAKLSNNVIWSQPLLIMQNRYPSAMVNQWDGNLDLGETDKGTIMTPRLVAGKKNSDNTFTGVMMGDWGKTNSDNSITSTVGLYGFSSGEQSFAFKEDGTAFIGKSGGGRIHFDGNSGIIESGTYRANDSTKGVRIDLSNGQIDAHTFTLTAGISKGLISVGEDNTISIDTTDDNYPLRIGSKFKVSWDGSVEASNGVFSGKITADTGKIGDFDISAGALTVTNGSYTTTMNSNGFFSIGPTIDKSSWISNGEINTGNIVASGGTIGDVKIVNNTLQVNKIYSAIDTVYPILSSEITYTLNGAYISEGCAVLKIGFDSNSSKMSSVRFISDNIGFFGSTGSSQLSIYNPATYGVDYALSSIYDALIAYGLCYGY